MKYHLNKLFILFIFAFTSLVNAQVLDKDGIPEPPVPPRLVNDYAGLMSSTNVQNLEDKLVRYNDSTSSQIVIVTLKTLDGYPIEDYAIQLARKWEIGQKDKDNGILILVAKEDRLMRIEVGTGLEPYVTDLATKRIREEILAPAFKQSNYFKGLDDATDRLFQLMTGTFHYDESDSKRSEEFPSVLFVILVILFFLFLFYFMSKSSKRGYTMSGGGWTWGGGGGGGWSSGGSWGGSSGGGGFGGFGGGGFSGGGSSGSW